MAEESKILVVTDVIPMESKITEHKLTGPNYLDWCKTVKIYLPSLSKDDHLTDDPPTNETRKEWLRDDACLFLQIRNSIDIEVVSIINHCEYVKDLMEYLEFLYSRKGNISHIYEVCKGFYRAEQQDQFLQTYFMNFKRTYEELNVMLPFSSDVKVQKAFLFFFIGKRQFINQTRKARTTLQVYRKYTEGAKGQKQERD